MADIQTAPPVPTGSALPRAMQVRLDAMEASNSNPPTEPVTPVAPVTTTEPATPVTPVAETVTISRDEFNTLQANAGKTQAALARAENERLKQEDMSHRLTELEKLSKSVPEPTLPAPAIAVEAVEFTQDEEKEFGDSKEYIAKVVKQQLGAAFAQINALVTELRTEVAAARQTATGAATTVAESTARSFLSQVQAAVPNLQQIKLHKNWGDYLDETDEMSGATYEQLLAHNVKNGKLDQVKNIYKRFEAKYMQGVDTTAAGYNGGAPSGSATEVPVVPAAQGKLKQSDRRKASEDYRKGKITWDQLQTVNKKFEEADKAGNIDFDH
ncbi:MAG: hypothetical protein V4649_19615 [Bacteroidota bacterium]